MSFNINKGPAWLITFNQIVSEENRLDSGTNSNLKSAAWFTREKIEEPNWLTGFKNRKL